MGRKFSRKIEKIYRIANDNFYTIIFLMGTRIQNFMNYLIHLSILG